MESLVAHKLREMSNNYENLRETLDSFGIDADSVDIPTDKPEADLVEWVEKLNGDVENAFRLCGLGGHDTAAFPSINDPSEIQDLECWSYYDPARPVENTCPITGEKLILVEVFESASWSGSDVMGLASAGYLVDVKHVGNPGDSIYCYDETAGEYAISDSAWALDSVAHGGDGGTSEWPNTARVSTRDGSFVTTFRGWTAYRPSEFFDFEGRDLLESLIRHERTKPAGWVKVYSSGDDLERRASEVSRIRRWLSSWVSHDEGFEDYHFRFPSVVVQHTNPGGRIRSCSLYVPDDPEAVEEATEWIDRAAEYRPARRGSTLA